MKTIVCADHQREFILHQMAAEGKGGLAGVRAVSLRVLLREEREDIPTVLFMIHQKLNENAASFPLYRNMFMYPAFIREIYDFANECILYDIDIDTLPKTDERDIELKKIISLVLTMDLASKKNVPAAAVTVKEFLRDEDLALYPYFETDPYYEHIRQKFISAGKELPMEEVHPTETMHSAVNTRQELEAVAQHILKSKKTSTIVLTNYEEQYPFLHQVFSRYSIPFEPLKENADVRIPKMFAALVRFGRKKDVESFLQAVRYQAFGTYAALDIISSLERSLTDPSLAPVVTDSFTTGLFDKNLKSLQYTEKRVLEWFEKTKEARESLLEANDPESILRAAYGIIRKSFLLKKDPEMAAAREIRTLLGNIIHLVKEEDLPFLVQYVESIRVQVEFQSTDFCIVTDLTHPVRMAEETFVVGCSGRNYPQMPVREGIFDEEYVSRIQNYPSLNDRYELYMNQIDRFSKSAFDHVYYSCPQITFEGKEVIPAFELTSRFDTITPWPLERLQPRTREEHFLTPKTADKLFKREDDKIHGSITSIERWFNNPYDYFLASGLHLYDSTLPDMDNLTFGNIMHAYMEDLLKQEERPDIPSFLRRYFYDLTLLYPNKSGYLSMSERRLTKNLATSIEILDEINAGSAFKQAEAEKTFELEIVPGLLLNGKIDRLDIFDKQFRIIDFKSSSKTLSESNFKKGLQLQLLTYLYAVRKETDMTPAAACYFSLQPEVFTLPAMSISRKVITEIIPDEDTLHDGMISSRRLSGWRTSPEKTALDENGTHFKKLSAQYDYKAVEKILDIIYKYFTKKLLAGYIKFEPSEYSYKYSDYRQVERHHGMYRKPQFIQGTEEIAVKITSDKSKKAKEGKK